MDVIDVVVKVVLIPKSVFPKAPLPDGGFALFLVRIVAFRAGADLL
jgi:hypothetical protein